MPAYETPEALLRTAVGSVLGQTYPSFELIVVDDGSASPVVADVLHALSNRDRRLRVLRRPVNGGIVAASNDALGLATGAFIGMVDHDDLLEPRALDVCARYLQAHPRADLLYTDEDWIDLDGEMVGPFWKPDWSP